MHLPMDDVQAFVQVAELGSFTRAADRLALTQTGLTRRIQRLEAFVGLPLLDRTTRRTTLTAAGRDFLPLAKRVVDDLTHGLERLRTIARLNAGDVTLATMPDAGRLAISWKVLTGDEGEPRAALTWVEDRPDLPSPAAGDVPRRGYGRDLIEQALRYTLGARTSYEITTRGVRCIIDTPLERRARRRPQA